MILTVKDFIIEHRVITVTTKECVDNLPLESILKGSTTTNNRFIVKSRDKNMLILQAEIPVENFRIGMKLKTV